MSVIFRPCVLIPCYNHGAMIASVLSRLAPFGLPCLVVDDGSTDGTAEALQKFPVRILRSLSAGRRSSRR